MIYLINTKTKEHIDAMTLGDAEYERLAGSSGWIVQMSDIDGWIEWGGGECPLPEDVEHESRLRDGRVVRHVWNWSHSMFESCSDVIAYRPVLNASAEPEPPAWDGGGLPPVGERVRIRTAEGDQGCADVVAHHNAGCVVWQHSDMEYRRWHPDFLRPILANKEEDMSWNGEGLPPVGVECVFIGTEDRKGVITHHMRNGNAAVIEYPSGGWDGGGWGCFRPIRSEGDRAVDALKAATKKPGRCNMLCDSWAKAIYAAIRDGKIPGVRLDD